MDEKYQKIAKAKADKEIQAENLLKQHKKAQQVALAKEQIEQQKDKIMKQYQNRKVNIIFKK